MDKLDELRKQATSDADFLRLLAEWLARNARNFDGIDSYNDVHDAADSLLSAAGD